jgi:pimeloyl-ACP methyl ester carboxylesterase/DNA-binding CsgD family transcriptional regulator
VTITPSSPEVRFCTTRDGVRIAYAVSGSGPVLLKAANWLNHAELDWDSPVWGPWLRFLSEHRTLVRYDARGCGLSDRDVGDISLDGWLSDLRAVIEHACPQRFDLLGMSQGGPVAVRYASQEPHRVERLVLYGAYVRGRNHQGLSKKEKDAALAMKSLMRSGWGQNNPAFRQLFTSLFIPGGSETQMRWFNELERVATEPETAARIVEVTEAIDVTDEARQVQSPTLVLHAHGDARVPLSEGRLMAALVPGARFVELASDNHVLLDEEPAWHEFRREVAAFLGFPERRSAFDSVALTARERDVTILLVDGLTNKQIAKSLQLSEKTVRNYVSIVLAKLGATTRTEAATKAIRAGVASADTSVG